MSDDKLTKEQREAFEAALETARFQWDVQGTDSGNCDEFFFAAGASLGAEMVREIYREAYKA